MYHVVPLTMKNQFSEEVYQNLCLTADQLMSRKLLRLCAVHL